MPVVLVGKGPRLDAFRAYLNNDAWISGVWFEKGLYNLRHRLLSKEIIRDNDGEVTLRFTIESQAPNGGKMIGNNGNSQGIYYIAENDSVPFGPDDFKFISKQEWTVRNNGVIYFDSDISSNDSTLILPRLGFVMEVPQTLGEVSYYGRGPEENYNDRKTGQFVGRYDTTVKKMMTPYTRPQSNGNREEVRWAALTDGEKGLTVVAPELMSFSVSPYTEMELFLADHPFRLPDSKRNVVHLDLGVTGLGGASCGQGGPLPDDRILAGSHKFPLIFRPAVRSSFLHPSTLNERAGEKCASDVDFSSPVRK